MDIELQRLAAPCIGEQIELSGGKGTDSWSIKGTLVSVHHKGQVSDNGTTRIKISLGESKVQLTLPSTHPCWSQVQPDRLNPLV